MVFSTPVNKLCQGYLLTRCAFSRSDRKMLFLNGMNTDGFSCDFLFCRASPTGANCQTLELTDFTYDEVQHYFRPLAVDTGVRNLFTASYGTGSEQHEIRNFSSAEWHANSGSKRRNAKVQAEKDQAGIGQIEAQWPTAKTANVFGYQQHLRWYFENRSRLLQFYNFERGKERFQAYQGKQKALEEATNVLINGGKKHDPDRRKHTDRNRKSRRRRKKKPQKQAAERYDKTFIYLFDSILMPTHITETKQRK